MRLGTEEDLARDFPEGFAIGFPVRPPSDVPPPPTEQPPAEEDRPTSS